MLAGESDQVFLSSCWLKVGRVLKKPEDERSEEEAAVLLLHRDTVEELCKRQVRRNVLKRKQEEVRLSGPGTVGLLATKLVNWTGGISPVVGHNQMVKEPRGFQVK